MSRTWIGRVAAAAEDRFKPQEVLLAHGSGLPVVLPAPELGKLEGDNFEEEECVRVCPVPLIGTSWGNDARFEPDNLLWGLGDQASVCQHAGGYNTCDRNLTALRFALRKALMPLRYRFKSLGSLSVAWGCFSCLLRWQACLIQYLLQPLRTGRDVGKARSPAAPSMAKRAWMTSLYLSHSGVTKPPAPSGSESPRGSAQG